MSNEQQFIITCRFPGWEMEDITGSGKKLEYPPYGIKYLFTMGIIPIPEWDEDDKRWFSYSEDTIIIDEFKKAFELTIKKEFIGEILFIEPASFVSMKAEGIR